MSLLEYKVTVKFIVDATDLETIHDRLETLADAGEIVETRAKAVSAKAKAAAEG